MKWGLILISIRTLDLYLPDRYFAWNRSYFDLSAHDARLGGMTWKGAYQINDGYFRVSEPTQGVVVEGDLELVIERLRGLFLIHPRRIASSMGLLRRYRLWKTWARLAGKLSHRNSRIPGCSWALAR
jgi:hypothetical protein